MNNEMLNNIIFAIITEASDSKSELGEKFNASEFMQKIYKRGMGEHIYTELTSIFGNVDSEETNWNTGDTYLKFPRETIMDTPN